MGRNLVGEERLVLAESCDSLESVDCKEDHQFVKRSPYFVLL